MNISQLEKDYYEVRDRALGIFGSCVNPVRCHEMAYLITVGLRRKGYKAKVIDGLYENRMAHSWVQVKNGLDFSVLKMSVLIDFQFNYWSPFFAQPIWRDCIVTSYEQKKSFKKRKIRYQLAEGIERLAEQLFSNDSK